MFLKWLYQGTTWLPEDDPRIETRWSDFKSFNAKFYVSGLVGVIIKVILQNARWNNKDTQISNLKKIPSVRAKLFNVDRRTEWYDEANSAFLKFAKAPINQGKNTPAEGKHNTIHCLLKTFQQIQEGGSCVWSAGGCTNVDKCRQATMMTEEQSCER